ncbi:MAG: hypothetical protein M1827_004883 [Pycnora praestabilis]|nr:MAG: hypothetical protein M1827_004883 [Pycnora praestabilis]
MGPNVLSFRQPQAIKDIYGAGKHFKKSDYYPVNAAVGKGEYAHTLFSNPDQTWHNNVRRSIGASFTLNSAVKYESLIDTTISVFLKELDQRFAGKEGENGIIDFHTWLLYFTFDVMGDLTYSARHGFMEQGKDMFSIINYIKEFLNYGFIAGQMPSVDVFLRHNPVLMWLERRGWISSTTFPGVPFAIKHMQERKKRYGDDVERHVADQEDLLDKFLRAKRERPEIITEREVLGLSLSMMIAGSETTTIRFAAADALPYLTACVQEAFRLHPAFGFNFERIVPDGGASICGHVVPSGTIVGVNAWVVQRDQGIFGADAGAYRPERWLLAAEEGGAPKEAERARVKEMEKTMFQFGAGDHICLGKNVSAVEIYKVVPALMRNFEMSLADPHKEWTLINGANVRMSGVDIRIRRRE